MATTAQMLTDLGLKLVDVSEGVFLPSDKLNALNDAQLMLALILNNNYLREFQAVDELDTLTDNLIPFSDLSTVLGREDAILLIEDNATGNILKPITLDDVKSDENAFLAASDNNLKFYIQASNIVMLSDTDITEANVTYLKVPVAMVSGGQTPILNAALHPLLVRFAMSRLLLDKADPERVAQGAAISQVVNDEIKVLNGRA